MSLTLRLNLGDLKIHLRPDLVREPCENYLALAASGAYDGAVCHRVIRGFICQFGIPKAAAAGADRQVEDDDGSDDSIVPPPPPVAKTKVQRGTSAWGTLLQDRFHHDLRHDARGVVSFASAGPDTVGSQFFITFAAQPQLDDDSTIVGRVVAGLETLDAIEVVDVDAKNRPEEVIYIKSVTIHANPLAT